MNITTVQRKSKALLALFVGLFAILVGVQNIVDWDTNYEFVQNVLSMNAMQPHWSGEEALGWRAITSPAIHTLAYLIIIVAEIATGVLALMGARKMFSHDSDTFTSGKAHYLAGATIGITLWFFGFCVIASEWFAMWASEWNAQDTAFYFSIFLLATMIYISQGEES